jgi:hypothetical protein
MLYQHEKPCSQRKQTRVEPSFPTTISQIQCFPTDGLRVPLKCTHGFAYQTWNFPIPSHTFRCFMFASSKYVYDHSFHKLTMRYSIFSKIYLSTVVPSLLQFSWARITKELKFHDDVNQPLQERRSSCAWEDRWRPLWTFPLFLPRNLGLRFL